MQSRLWVTEAEAAEIARAGLGKWLCAARAASPREPCFLRTPPSELIPPLKCELGERRVSGCFVFLDWAHSRPSTHLDELK